MGEFQKNHPQKLHQQNNIIVQIFEENFKQAL